jgi:hypothetical protein
MLLFPGFSMTLICESRHFPDSYNMNKYFLTIYFRLTKGMAESSPQGLNDPGFLTIGRVLDYEENVSFPMRSEIKREEKNEKSIRFDRSRHPGDGR